MSQCPQSESAEADSPKRRDDAGYVDGRAEHDIQHLVYSTVRWNRDWERDGHFDGIQCDIDDCPVGYRNGKCRSVSSLPDHLGSWQRRYRE